MDSYSLRAVRPEHNESTIACLRRVIDRSGWTDPGREPSWHSACPVRMDGYSDEVERYNAWLHESVLTGLATLDPLIAVRAYGQACSYMGRVYGKVPTAMINDALMALRNRLEAMLALGATTIGPALQGPVAGREG